MCEVLLNKARPQSGVTFAGRAASSDVGKIFGFSTLFPSARAVTAVPPAAKIDTAALQMYET